LAAFRNHFDGTQPDGSFSPGTSLDREDVIDSVD
jgi:hypothetical protein